MLSVTVSFTDPIMFQAALLIFVFTSMIGTLLKVWINGTEDAERSTCCLAHQRGFGVRGLRPEDDEPSNRAHQKTQIDRFQHPQRPAGGSRCGRCRCHKSPGWA